MKKVLLLNVEQRYNLLKVFLWLLAISFSMFLFVFITSILVKSEFNWTSYREYLPHQILGTIAIGIFFYFSLNYFHYLFKQRKKWVHFLAPASISIVSIEAYNITVDYLKPLSNNKDLNLSIGTQIAGNLVIAIPSLLASLLIAYVNNLRDERKKHRLLEEQKLKLEVEKTQADLKFLKSQINPHFLHNTLNSFYARSLPLSTDLAEGILTLSEMMRYALDETTNKEGKVPLRSEIEQMRNLIKINQFRFRNNLNVQLCVTGEINDELIIPFVLITLVENIFKHGDLTSDEYPVTITVDVKDGQLHYISSNKKQEGPKELSRGIGLDNIRKRLSLAYGADYKLQISDEGKLYTTELLIYQL